MAGPVRVEELASRPVDALVGVRAEEIALSLEQVCRQASGPVTVVERQGGRERRRGDAMLHTLRARRDGAGAPVDGKGKSLATGQLAEFGLQQMSWGAWDWPLWYASDERAILEFLQDVPTKVSVYEADALMQGLANLRPNRVTALLRACQSVKVKRLFLALAAVGVIVDFRRGEKRNAIVYITALAAVMAAAPLAGTLASGLFLHPRHVLGALPFFLALSAGGVDAVIRWAEGRLVPSRRALASFLMTALVCFAVAVDAAAPLQRYLDSQARRTAVVMPAAPQPFSTLYWAGRTLSRSPIRTSTKWTFGTS